MYRAVAAVTFLSVIERFLGFLYRIVLSRTLGAEGMGIYQIALSVFAVLITITSSGVPITVSRLMSKYRAKNDFHREKSVIAAGIAVSLLFSLPVVILLFVLGDKLDFLFSDVRCRTLFFIMLPGLIFTSVYAVFRGSFWGKKDFMPYSIIELLEEVCMVIVGTASMFFMTSVFNGAVRAAFAVLVSYLFSFTLSSIVFFKRGGRLRNPKGEFRPLLSSALPITGMRTVSSIMNSLIAIVLPLKLVASGLTNTEAISQFGSASGMAIPILFMPSTLIGSLALVLVPELAETYYKGDHAALKRTIEKALKFSVFVSAIIIPVFLAMGKDIGVIVYGSEEAGIFISRSAIMMLPMSISMITTSMLNSMGLEKKTLFTYLLGAASMMLSILFLTKYIGINSLLLGHLLSFCISAAGNLILLNKKSIEKPKYLKFIMLSTLFIIPSSALGYFLNNLLSEFMHVFFSCMIASVVTVAFNLLFYLLFNVASFDLIKGKLGKKRANASVAEAGKSSGN